MALTAKEKTALERAKTNSVNRAQNTVNSKANLRTEAQGIALQAANITVPPAAAAKATAAAAEAANVATALSNAQAEIAGIHRKRSLSTIGEAETRMSSYCQDAEVALGAAKALLQDAIDLANEKARIETTAAQVETLRGEIKLLLDDLKNKATEADTFAKDAKKHSDKVTELRPGSQQATDAANAATKSDDAAKAGKKVVDGDPAATPPVNGVVAHLAVADIELEKARNIRDGVVAGDLAAAELCLTNIRREKEAAQKLAEALPQHLRDAEKGHDDAKSILDEIEKVITDPPLKGWLEKHWKSIAWGVAAFVCVLVAFIWGGLAPLAALIALVVVIAPMFASEGANAFKMAMIAFALMVVTLVVDLASVPFIGGRVARGGPAAEDSQTNCRTGWANDPCATMSYKATHSPLFWLAIGLLITAAVWLVVNRDKLPTWWNSLQSRITAWHP